MTVLYVVFGLLVLVALYFAAVYNRLVRMRNRIDNAWAQIGVLLKRRADLIPNVVSTVKGYAAHEAGTFEDVTRARAASEQATGVAEQAQAENAVTSALGRLFALSEAYPQLQAEQEFKGLRDQLAQTESTIAAARQLYNDDVLAYENVRETLPSSIVAWFLGFEPRDFFQIDDPTAQLPRVEFGSAAAAPSA